MRDKKALTALEFSRYRVFEAPQRLDLKPMTLLFGQNSAGKSAALRLLPILAAAAQRQRIHSATAVLDYSSPALRGALLQDLIHNGQSSSGMQFCFHWENGRYQTTLHDLGSDGEAIRNFKIELDGLPPSEDSGDIAPNKFEVLSGETKSNWTFSGLNPEHADTEDGQLIVSALQDRMDAFATSVHWLGAVRTAVPRHFELVPGASGQITFEGSGVAQAIRLSATAKDGAAEAVSKWLQKTCNCTLSFASSDEVLAFNRRFYPFNVVTSSGRQIAVRDVGEGIAQALPVVMLCHQARLGQLGPNPILAFEQPELHLHPSASVKLADEIVACIADGSEASHVIETHAESMLLSVQIAIVEKRISPDDVIVYWVSSGEAGTSLRPIKFDKDGFAEGGWPQGVFRETHDQARRLAQLRIEPTES